MAPQIRDLNGLIATLSQGVAGQKQQIDSDIAANQTYGDAQIAGLDAKKTRAFADIEQGAQNKGMFFSGFSPDAQATYTADTYLPALAGLQQTIAQTRSQLLGKKADLDSSVFDKAFNSQEQDRSILADWNKMTAQQQFEASQADKQRAFEAQQNQMQIAAASRSGGGGGSSGPTAAQAKSANQASLQQDIASAFSQFTDKDFKNGATEKLYAQLMNAYAGDVSPADISKSLYSYRKAQYGR